MNIIKKNNNFSKLYEKVKKAIQNSSSKTINFQTLIFLASYEKFSGYYHQDSKKNILDDFITSPLISNFFGYLIGFFFYLKWKKFFYKKKIDLIELGPGTGKLILDILNFLKQTEMFEFIQTIKIVEINDFFQEKQKNKLRDYEDKIEFYKDFSQIKFQRSFFIFSNEFFDCLPFNQFVYKDNQFFETVIFFDSKKNEFCFGLEKKLSNNIFLLEENENFIQNPPKDEQIFEISSFSINICKEINQLLEKFSGLNIIIDYGFLKKNEYKSSIQCIKNHKNISLSDLIKFGGDISSHVNFEYFQKIFNHDPKKEFFLDEQYIFFNQIFKNFKEFYHSIDQDFLLKIQEELLKFNKKNSENDIGKLFKILYIIK